MNISHMGMNTVPSRVLPHPLHGSDHQPQYAEQEQKHADVPEAAINIVKVKLWLVHGGLLNGVWIPIRFLTNRMRHREKRFVANRKCPAIRLRTAGLPSGVASDTNLISETRIETNLKPKAGMG